MAKSFVKALYDYHSGETGDLSFIAGDIIQVLNQIDENWIRGEHDGNVGLFPANFVEPMDTPVRDRKEGSPSAMQETGSVPTGKTVVAKETYISGEDGVLTFFRGDELTLLEKVDEYWCHGSVAGEFGLFPAHLVEGLNDVLTSPQITQAEKTIPLQENIIKPTLQEPHAKTLFDFKGLSDFEISFPAGETVILTKEIDDDWFEGMYNGSTGIFPKSFVEVLVPLPTDQVQSIKTKTIDIPYAIAVYPFVGETSSELSFREGEVIFLHHWVSSEWIQGECNGHVGIFPSTFVQIEKELPQAFEELSGRIAYLKSGEGQLVTQDEVVNSVFKIGDRTLAIYSYATDIEGDLHLDVGDLIWIEQVIDEEWVLGRKGEHNVGLCPAVFLELQPNESIGSFDKTTVNMNKDVYSVEKTDHQMVNSHPLKSTGDKWYNELEQKYESGSVSHTSQITSSVTNSDPDSTLTGSKGSPVTNQPQLNHVSSSKTKSKSTHPTVSSTPEIQHPLNTPLSESQNIPPAKNEPIKNSAKAPRVKPGNLTLGPKPPLGPKPLISPKPDFLKKPVKPALPPKPVTPSEKSSGFSKLNAVNENGWVKFEEPNEAPTSVQPAETQQKPKRTAPARNKISGQSFSMSYKALLDKSRLEEDHATQLPLEPSKRPPVPPPRVDLVPPPRVDLVPPTSTDALESKLMEQAEGFEKSSSRQNSPSLNELRARAQKPVPAKRSKQSSRPLLNHSHDEQGGGELGFSILNELDEQTIKLKNELQKENQVLSGVEVLIQTVNKDTSRRGELESKKGITERRIEELKRQLKKTEDQKKRLVKLLAGYASQEEIHLKIQQLQETIKENTDTKNNLQSLLSECKEEEIRSDLQDNINFCDEAIKNLQSQLDSVLELVAELEGKVLKEEPVKNVTHRKKVIDEILNTEKSFAGDLNLCLKSFKMQLIQWKVEIIDCEMLFGNMDEVAALSSRLLQRLETATNDVDINSQIIGTCFVDFSEEMTIVYGKYCRNHDEAIAFLEKSAGNEEIQQYLNKCLESIREFSNCWDLSSFLIKPVQRILKYPLLLNELLKNTPDEHPDKPGLIKAIDVMTIAANDVNEFKRRKELVLKYQKVEESGLSTKFQKFTWHSVLKKSSRFNQRITQRTGWGSQTVDEKFNENERLFYQIEKTAKNLIKNITQYIEQFENVHENQVQTAENIIDFYKENSTAKEVQEYNTAQRFIGEDLVNKLKHILDEEVLLPLNTLINLFQGPHRLIQKRHDKCLDYDSWSHKVEKMKDHEKWKQAKDELEFAKKNYEALNAQLLDELPVLNTKSLKFLQTCVANFACVHKNFFVEALDQFSPSVQLSVVNPGGNMDIISDFFSQNKIASHEVFQLLFTPKKSLTLTRPVRPNISPKASRSNLSVDEKHSKQKSLKRSSSESKRKAPLPPSEPGGGLVRSRTVSAGDRSLLMKKRVQIDLEADPSSSANHQINLENSTYIMKYAFTAEAPTELSVSKDDVITALEYHDAFGHSEWWKVEHNGKVGFVPSSFLAPYTMVPQSGLNSVVQISGHTSNGSVLKTGINDYLVKYDFEPHGPTELGVMTGDVVKVVKQSDNSGSNEWWLVQARGKQGYIPASYLVKR